MEIYNNVLNWENITQQLEKSGWLHKEVGIYKSGSNLKEIEGFELYVRQRDFDDFLKMSSLTDSQNPLKSRVSRWGSDTAMGNQECNLTPTTKRELPVLSDFEKYPSMMAARPDKPCILIGYDSEWDNLDDGGRELLSWQFAVVHGHNLIEFVFFKDGKDRISLDLALGCILDYLNVPSIDVRKIRRYAYCDKWKDNKPQVTITDSLDEARAKCVYVYKGADAGEVDGWTHQRISDMPESEKCAARSKRDWAYFHTFLDYKAVKPINVTLLCHYGIADLTSVTYNDYFNKRLTDVQGGIVSMQPIRTAPKSLKKVNNTSVYPLSLSVADTMCHAPVGKKKLEDLGVAVGIHKIDIPKEQKEHMLDLLINDPSTFVEYASTDSVVTLMYASALYGYNNTPAITITSATAKVMKGSIMTYMNITNNKEFDEKYRGLKTVSHGKVELDNNLGFLEASSLEPISDKVHTIQYYCTQSFRGGYNGCSEVGYFPDVTYDYDMQNAYATVMCLVPDPDYENNPIKVQIQNRQMDIRDFMVGNFFNPLVPFVGYCRFKFPKNVKYPCIPINVDGVPCYPSTSDGLDGVYVAGPFVYLALRLGAEVFCENGYFINTKLTDDYKESRSLSFAVKQLVQDRKKAKNDHGKGCLEELTLKMMVCSGYGKVGQNVIDKHTWSAFKDEMENIGCSAITDPFRAMMITSIVQCTLLAAQNQLNDLGYMSCSNTTDGFMSNCLFKTLKELDLYGFKPYLEQARLFLTDGQDPNIWEIKHCQDDLINITTRGNVSLHYIDKDKDGNIISQNPMIFDGKAYPGVCAHNSAKSGYKSDSYEDRLWYMTQVLSRTGPIECTNPEFSNWKTFVQSEGKKDFNVSQKTRKLHMDFDMKRKPIRSSFHTDYPIINGVQYEIAHFDTEPFHDVGEFRLYRKKKELCGCLRTQADWDSFFLKVDTNACGMKVKDLDWSIIVSIIMGYRAGKWDIPALDGLTVDEKCIWINQHNDSKHQFKKSDWKNARRPERQVNMLPKEMIQDKLFEMMTAA